MKATGPITPHCLLREFAGQRRERGQIAPWKTIYESWLKLHPYAADHTTVFAATPDMLNKLRIVEPGDKSSKSVKRTKKAKAA
ncbi:MAG: hypothetical protein K8J31_20700 [Anaerolineae bacterium]|nr:hypothetical protein [Anaerolineae bacterium]